MARIALPVPAGAVRKLLKEIESSGRGEHVLAVGGAGEHAAELRQQLLRGGAEPGSVRLRGPEGADVYVHVLVGASSDEDVAMLRRARRARVPVIAVAVGLDDDTAPHVLATDIVSIARGQGFPLGRIVRAIAARLGEDGAPLAARIPVLREAVCEQLVASAARKNGMLAAAIWIPGADLPVLLLTELRLVLRLAQVYGADGGRERLPELGATLGAGLGLRALARELLDLIPVAGWALKGAVAYGGTRALGEAACRRFSERDLRSRSLG